MLLMFVKSPVVCAVVSACGALMLLCVLAVCLVSWFKANMLLLCYMFVWLGLFDPFYDV